MEAIDVIAIVILLGGFVLMSLGIDHTVSAIIIMVASYYFGKKSGGAIIKKNG